MDKALSDQECAVRVDAIILARGGSKGIPKKNILEFCGKPLLAWSIEQCLQASSVNTVWVSSDDDQILRIAEIYGAKLIKRPEEISGDTATSESGWLHAADYIEGKGVNLDAILAPQVTSPLRKPGDIDRAVEKFILEDLDSLFASSIVDDLFFWGEGRDGVMTSINYDYKHRKRRQDLQKQIIESGSFYLFDSKTLRLTNNRFGKRIGYYEMELWQMFEIDDVNDLRMCSALMREFILV